MLLTRAPLYSWYCYHFLVRLACVRHAASVDSEPGSNSRLKPDVFPPRRRSVGSTVPALAFSRKERGTLPCEMTKPNLIASHDWHVQPICQRSLRMLRLSGTLLDRGLDFWSSCPRTWCASPQFLRLRSGLRRFCANLLKLSKSVLQVKETIRLNHSG